MTTVKKIVLSLCIGLLMASSLAADVNARARTEVEDIELMDLINEGTYAKCNPAYQACIRGCPGEGWLDLILKNVTGIPSLNDICRSNCNDTFQTCRGLD